MERKNLFQLFVPIAFEALFFMLAGMVDTLMLSSVGDAVMTQYIGAGRVGVAYQAKQLGALFNGTC